MLHKTAHRNLVLVALTLLMTSVSFAFDIPHLVLKTAGHALAKESRELAEKSLGKASTTVPTTGTIEVAFSPNESAEELVIKAIQSAKIDIHVLAYSFTTAPITKALLDARKREVSIKLVVDHKSNIAQDTSGKAQAALSALSTAGVEVRTISAYAIHHDKVVIDGRTTELDSFNFSASAANRNSENVLVMWDNPALAKAYLTHFERNYRQSTPFELRY